MDRNQLVRALTMDAIANDYESFRMIVSEVGAWGQERNINVGGEEIAEILAELVKEGLANCYHLSTQSAPKVVPMCAENDCYFLLTDKGKLAIREY